MKLIRSFVFIAATTLCLAFASSYAVAETASRQYSAEQVALIMDMRENGDSLADVAKVVGGSRKDVKAAEKAEKLRVKSKRAREAVERIAVASR